MKKNPWLIISLSMAGALAAGFCLWKPGSDVTEAQRVAEANSQYYADIFSRCSEIRSLAQFIEVFEPSEALEFFDNETRQEVVSIASVAYVNDEYEATFVAPVTLLETGKYQLNGNPKFFIKDLKGGVFTKHLPNGTTSGPTITLGPVLWQRFVAGGAGIESLREFSAPSEDA